MVELITVATVPYTGTHSIMSVIDSGGYAHYCNALLKSKTYRERRDKGEEDQEKLISVETDTSTHILLQELAFRWPEIKEKVGDILHHPLFKPDKSNVVHGHMTRDTSDVIRELSEYTRIIMTVRDPLITLISCRERDLKKENRQNKTDEDGSTWMSQQIDSWKWFVELADICPLYVPVDLPCTISYKGYDLGNLDIRGSYGVYPLKQAYYNRRLEDIITSLNGYYDDLLEMSPQLRPILEDIGYRNLMWWDDYENPKNNK